jgi:hypothetical protein
MMPTHISKKILNRRPPGSPGVTGGGKMNLYKLILYVETKNTKIPPKVLPKKKKWYKISITMVPKCQTLELNQYIRRIFMQAYEFSSVIDNGIIHVPEYIERLVSPVKVIILANEDSETPQKKTFSAIKLKTKGFKFDRDLANER